MYATTLEVNNLSLLIATLCMSQERPDSLVGGVFGRHISYYARSQNTQIFVTPLYVSHEGPSSLFIGYCRIGLLYLIHHTLISRVIRVRF